VPFRTSSRSRQEGFLQKSVACLRCHAGHLETPRCAKCRMIVRQDNEGVMCKTCRSGRSGHPQVTKPCGAGWLMMLALWFRPVPWPLACSALVSCSLTRATVLPYATRVWSGCRSTSWTGTRLGRLLVVGGSCGHSRAGDRLAHSAKVYICNLFCTARQL